MFQQMLPLPEIAFEGLAPDFLLAPFRTARPKVPLASESVLVEQLPYVELMPPEPQGILPSRPRIPVPLPSLKRKDAKTKRKQRLRNMRHGRRH